MSHLIVRRLGAVAAVAALLLSHANPAQDEAGFVGLQIQGLSQEAADALGLGEVRGVLVRDVAHEGPSAQAGFRRGDLIVRMAGEPIDTFERLIRIVERTEPGTVVAVEVLRAGKPVKLTVETGLRPESWRVTKEAVATIPEIGLTMAAVTATMRERFGLRWGSMGVLVPLVDPEKIAAAALQRGDLIQQVNQEDVWEPAQLMTKYEQAKERGLATMLLLVESQAGFRFLLLPLK